MTFRVVLVRQCKIWHFDEAKLDEPIKNRFQTTVETMKVPKVEGLYPK